MRWIILILTITLVIPAWANEIIYVDDDAALGGDGISWETAYRYLHDGLMDANRPGSTDQIEIRVAQGAYKPDRSEACPGGSGDREVLFELPEEVALKGGYAGLVGNDPNERDVDLYETVLSGDLGGDDVIDDPSQFRLDDSRLNNSLTVVNAGASSVLDGVIVRDGHALPYQCPEQGGCPDLLWGDPHWNGGGVVVQNDGVIIKNCRFFQNFSLQGGGAIYIKDATLYIESCIFSGNGSRYDGGGVCAASSHVEIVDSQFIGNWAGISGGGFSGGSSDSTILNCVFQENWADDGGGIYINRGMSLIQNTLLGYNHANVGGGANFRGYIELQLCSFIGNKANVGGGIMNYGELFLDNSLFAGNCAKSYGGCIYSRYSESLIMSNCTGVNNRASSGVFLAVDYQSSYPSKVMNCIVDNGGQEIYNQQSIISINFSSMQSRPSTIYDFDYLDWGQGNVDADPCFVDPGYWDSNNTPQDPNDDFYVAGDYHLKSQAGRWDDDSGTWVCDEVTSPCIDAGDPNSPIMYESFPNGGRINMGAYGGTEEASKSYFDCAPCETIIAGDINGDCKVNYLDLAILASHWLE